jgi:hypothetical protein
VHLRQVRTRSGGKEHRYAQLVQSYRRPDGVPAHRVVANLGELTEREVENIKLALQASRAGKTLVLPDAREKAAWSLRVLANLDYLHLAVAVRIWEYWKLGELFNRLLPKGGDAIAPGDVIAALTIQRCVSPGSKLYAQRWFPRTALPEVLGVDVEHFNNTRLHRVLEQLDSVDDELQRSLPVRYQQHDGAFVSLFMDVTDTWFEGRGCDLAARDRTKEGFSNRQKIGIVLLCSEKGYPLRWKVVAGKRRDAPIMADMLRMLHLVPWVGDAPLVCDRAMGQAGSVAKLVDSGIRFLTAAPRSEITSYTTDVPAKAILELTLGLTPATHEEDVEAVAKAAANGGMTYVEENLFVLDLGVRERELVFQSHDLESEPEYSEQDLTGGALAIFKARRLREMLDDGVVKSQRELARRVDVTQARIAQLLSLLRLPPDLQSRILAGEFGYVSEHLLRECVRVENKAKQLRILEEHAQLARTAASGAPIRRARTGRRTARLRLVLYFNPEMCVDQRTVAESHRQSVEDLVADLNRRLRSERARLDADGARFLLVEKLAALSLLKVYSIRVESVQVPGAERQVPQLRIDFDEQEWLRRRQHDGFVLLVADPEIPRSGPELVQLYRDKDAVEKDFQTIKDVVKLRPVYHHTDPKVRAHVTLCMLALLLERTLEQRLRRSSMPMSAPACFEQLASCHLNLLRGDPDLPPSYSVTEPTNEQRDLIKVLRMGDLLDPEEVAARIHPRTSARG